MDLFWMELSTIITCMLITTSSILLYISKGVHRKICAIFFLGILADEISFRILKNTLPDNLLYLCYISYALIETIILFNLRYRLKHNPTFILLFLTGVNIMYNMLTALHWEFKHYLFEASFNAFEFFIGAVVLLQLSILGRMLNDSRSAERRKQNGIGDIVDWLFCVRGWCNNRIFNR